MICACASALVACTAKPAAPPPSAAGSVPERSAVLEPARAAGPKVVFLGDSISAGLHLPADQAFPARVHAALAARGQAFELVNAGVSGDTTAGGLRRVDWLLQQAPAIVVVELGGNDGMRGQPIASIESNLRA
ncbi:MAG TPA: GDSL-type esterase/lipase family protein, partial [Polyangiales bacterium]|nr:GDSL-type esterase/lipase family protein [Polyangiales bacterium]